jgi:hypothetical protein
MLQTCLVSGVLYPKSYRNGLAALALIAWHHRKRLTPP